MTGFLSSRRRSRGVACAIAMLISGSAAGAHASPAGAQGRFTAYDSNNDGRADQVWYDADLNGHANRIWLDLSNDGWLDTAIYNSFGDDSFLETIEFDTNQDGIQDARCWDVDRQAGFDQCIVHRGRVSQLVDLRVRTVAAATVGVGGGYFDPSSPDVVRPDFVVVGGSEPPGGVPGLLIKLAGVTGRATFGSADSDHDLIPDGMDSYPTNPRYY